MHTIEKLINMFNKIHTDGEVELIMHDDKYTYNLKGRGREYEIYKKPLGGSEDFTLAYRGSAITNQYNKHNTKFKFL